MPRQICAPNDVDLESSGRRDYLVRFEHASLWGHHLMPVTVIVGAEAVAGRGLVAIGGTHGNEYEGPVAIKHLLAEINAAEVCGRLILVPTLNVMAFRAGQRDSPDDGLNLNRAFPGDAAGSVTSRVADFVSRLIFPHVHVVLDIHAGGRVARFPRCTSFHDVPNASQRRDIELTAREFGAPFAMIYQDETPGLLTSAAERLGKITVGAELGWGEAVSVEGVAMARRGIVSAAIRHGQFRGNVPPEIHCAVDEQVLVDASDPACSVLAAFDGHFEPTTLLGQAVEAGELLGWLHDFGRLDEAPMRLAAAHAGFVVCQAWEARVVQGQVIVQVARRIPWTAEA